LTGANGYRFALLADLHLSDLSGTAAHRALQWAVERVNRERPDFLAVAGDVTTYGTARSAALFLEELRKVEVPVFLRRGMPSCALLRGWNSWRRCAHRSGAWLW